MTFAVSQRLPTYYNILFRIFQQIITLYINNKKAKSRPIRRLFYKLFFVFVDFLKVLVGVNLELSASRLVASDDAVLVKLKCADGPSVVYTALNTVAECASLIVAADKKHYVLRIANGTNTNGKSGFVNLIGFVIKETRVCN